MESLPDVVWISIFDFLSAKEYFLTLTEVSKRWKVIIDTWNLSVARRLSPFG